MLAVPKLAGKNFALLAAVLASLALCSCESRLVKPIPVIEEGATPESSDVPAALMQASLEAQSEKVPVGQVIRRPASTSGHMLFVNR